MPIVPPSEEKEERVAALARGIVQAVPFAGGLLAESIDLWVNPVEKRKTRWVKEVSAAINQLCEDLCVLPETLANDERFVSFLMQATLIALRNHQEEKISALKAALTASTGTSCFSEDEGFVFLRYVDELTPTHLRILAHLSTQKEHLELAAKLDDIYTLVATDVANLDRTLFRICLRDLASRSLVVFDDIDDFPEYDTKREFVVTEASGKRPLTVTEAGTRFLAFIALGPNS